MTPALLVEIGQALGGERWQSALAATLGMDLRYLQRITAGERPIPDWMADELLPLLRHRRAAIDGLIDRLADTPVARDISTTRKKAL